MRKKKRKEEKNEKRGSQKDKKRQGGGGDRGDAASIFITLRRRAAPLLAFVYQGQTRRKKEGKKRDWEKKEARVEEQEWEWEETPNTVGGEGSAAALCGRLISVQQVDKRKSLWSQTELRDGEDQSEPQ